MELWIRSQDKNVLEKVKGFCITYGDETHWNIVNIDTTTRYGTYKTKERALEVLNGIQYFIEKQCMKHISSSGMFYEKYVVYQMPYK